MNRPFPGLDPYLQSFWRRSIRGNNLPEHCRETCLVCVFRQIVGFGEWELYPLPFRQELPVFRVPLRIGGDDVALDLQAGLDECYEKRRYERGIDYGKAPVPPLDAGDAAWAETLERERKGTA